MSVCCVQVHAHDCSGYKSWRMILAFLQLGLLVIHVTWMLGTEFRPSEEEFALLTAEPSL